MLRAVILFCVMRHSFAVIYRLNESEYERMPKLYELDDYSSCLLDPEGVYCVVDADLYTEGRSDLMKMIQGYSEYKMKHFNHTQIHRGVCVTTSCNSFIRNKQLNETVDRNTILEECLNHTMWKDYELNAKLAKVFYCKRKNDPLKKDLSDIIVAVIYIVIILMNGVGSLYDVLRKDKDSGNPYLLAFSIRRNWSKMTASSGGPDPRLSRLKLFHGMRTMTMVCVFFSHSVLMMSFSYVDNPLYIESSYEDPLKQILFNGSLVTHTFFVMSSFLLAFNFQLHAEKHKITWIDWPKGVLLRWLRLTPTYALILATLSTWMRHMGSGPVWDQVVTSEAVACRQWWWAHLLYINNYMYDDAFCAPQTWYLAADVQLFCVGLAICVVARGCRARKVALVILFLISLVTPAAHTYFQDLDAVVIQSPESLRNLYENDDTFRLLYVRGHTNLSTYTLGLAGGFLTYYWQKEGKDFKKFKNYPWVTWLVFPLGVAVILSGGFFYIDGVRSPAAFSVLYAMFYKPIFQTLVVMLIISIIFKFESIYRGIIEWRGFTWTGRVSYSAFLLHTLFQRGLVGIQTRPTHMTDYYVFMILSSTIFLSFMCAGALWILVEAPSAALTKAALSPPRRETDNTKV